jgi:DNA-directed primase/polymerase protein
MLEAVWDPVAGRVVFKEGGKAEERGIVEENTERLQSGSTESKRPDEAENLELRNCNSNSRPDERSTVTRRSNAVRDKEENLEWRSNNNNKSTGIRRPRSRGIAPSQFHQADLSSANSKPGHEAVVKLHNSIQQTVIQQQTVAARKQQEYQRQAFKQLTVHKTYPLQERAVSHCRVLRQEWGVPDEMTEDPQIVCTAELASSSSSSGTASSLDIPEAKRCFLNRELSPAKCQLVQQFTAEFLQQRAIEAPYQTGDYTKQFGPALWCLEPRVFCVESGTHGRRRYVAAHAGRFFDTYWRKTEPNTRHAYELIRPMTPCRLYLDLECGVAENPAFGQNTAIQEQLLTELFEELSAELQEQYGDGWTSGNRRYKLHPLQRRHVVDLDSSTDTKFSRHWIVHLTVTAVDDENGENPWEALFADAAAVGYFVRQWVGRLAEQQATGQIVKRRPILNEHLFVQTHSKSAVDGTSCLIDLGVYTRNRLFRLMGSSKFGKPVTAALRIAATNQFHFPESFGNDCFYVPEMTQLHLTTADDSHGHTGARKEDDVESEVQKSLAKTDWTIHAEALAHTLVVPLNVGKIDFPILPRLADAGDEAAPSKPSSRHASRSASALSIGKSPYQMVDDFVLNHLAVRGDTQGVIRAWSVETDNTTRKPIMISYQISRNRWCECVGRSHKSNNIAWHVDLLLNHCYQTCHDPDCRAMNFRGTPIPLPASVQESLQDALFEEELARLDIANLQSQPPSHSTQHPNSVDDDDTDESFEMALAALNIGELRTKVVVPKKCSGLDECEISEASFPCKQIEHCIPESSAERWRRLYGDEDRSDSSDVEYRSSTQRQSLESNNVADDEKSSAVPLSKPSPSVSLRARPESAKQRVDFDDDSSDDDDLLSLARKLEKLKNEREQTQRKGNSDD